jgi:hypothetical protein
MGNNEAGTTNLYPILTRYNLTNKNASYDTAYSRFHTETYINMTNGYLYAPKLYSGGTEVSVVGHTHSNYLTSHLYRPIQMNGTQILANSSSSALNLVAGTGITLSNSSGSVTISSSGGSVSGFYHEIVTVNGTAKHFSTEGSGKVIITSIENDLISGWFFRLIDSQSLIIENILYAEIMTVNNSPVGLNFIDTSGTWGSLSYDADWDSFDTWVIDSPMGSGDVSISYIGDF